jgi:hypothetical protein
MRLGRARRASAFLGSKTFSLRRRRPLVPIWVSLIASAVAIYQLGDRGLVSIVLVGSIAGVGSWWAYKFWPRSKASHDPKATDYLQDLERPSPGTAGPLNSGASEGLPEDPWVPGLENLRL